MEVSRRDYEDTVGESLTCPRGGEAQGRLHGVLKGEWAFAQGAGEKGLPGGNGDGKHLPNVGNQKWLSVARAWGAQGAMGREGG